MRDPSREKSNGEKVSSQPQKTSNKEQLKFVPHAHRFSEVIVKGEVKKPRVNFERPTPVLKPLEETLPVDEFLRPSSY